MTTYILTREHLTKLAESFFAQGRVAGVLRVLSSEAPIDDNIEDRLSVELLLLGRRPANLQEALPLLKATPLVASVWCSRCGGTKVQCHDWVDPNAGTIVGDFGTPWNQAASRGESWCGDCEDHTELTNEDPSRKADEAPCDDCGSLDHQGCDEGPVDPDCLGRGPEARQI